MRKKIIGFLAVLAFVVISCGEKTSPVKVNITWEDNAALSLTGKWYAAIAVGSKLVNAYELTFSDYKEVTPVTTTTISFTVNNSGYENFTVVVFNDTNGDGTFSADDLNWYVDTGMAESGVELVLDITARY